MQKKEKPDQEPSFAPGDDAKLELSASKKDKQKGNFTRVTALSFDEVDPS
ncbi:hypothetical protein [Pelotomaculum propionicicum]|uniref:Uncharacterized protein n=1 Tax=Pelotomaculum propionicicum TaxID=258475 RepID=A0A4Y7RZN1_9FIRM|nr:hypothetical protein [Pelotomaculum propionicicum]NLI13583.1 hypothetical protein [Peptococcaceae bacterium]TEB13737.1 hypothetical protein Pmgp_00144 [Pelotomaculum propionicicum]